MERRGDQKTNRLPNRIGNRLSFGLADVLGIEGIKHDHA
jgi:hypothetical protein